jgi:hypothetical protein
MSKTFTPKNLPDLALPLMNLKGKDYMLVAHRLLWFVNDVKSYTIDTHFPALDQEHATAQVTVTILDDQKNLVRRATAHKTETKKDFNDFAEKAETGALGRALASLGYGTAQALADLEEGKRIVDAPLEAVSGVSNAPATATSPGTDPYSVPTPPSAAKPSSFAKTTKKGASSAASNVVTLPTAPAAVSVPAPAVAKAADGWD